MNSNIDNNKRDFFKKTGSLIGLGLCACLTSSILTACDKDEEVSAPFPETLKYIITSASPLANAGGLSEIKIKNSKGTDVSFIIYRADATKFAVLEPICYHRGAGVSLTGGELVCSAHAAKFDKADGHTLSDGSAGVTVPPMKSYAYAFNQSTNELSINA